MTGREHLAAGFFAVLPALVLLLAGLIAALLDRTRRQAAAARRGVAAIGMSVALSVQLLGLLPLQPARSELLAAQGDASLDRFGVLAGALVIVLGLMTVVALPTPLGRLRPHLGAYSGALLALTAGGTIVCNSRALPGLYAGAELAGVSAVILVGLDKRSRGGARSAARLLVSGGVGSALALYGMALIVGLSGHTQVTDLARDLPGGALSGAAVTLVLAGLLLKLAVAPLLVDRDEARGGLAAATLAPLVAISTVAGYAFAARLMAVLPSGTRVPVEGALAALATVVGLGGAARSLRARTVADLANALGAAGVGLLLVALVGTRATSGGITSGLLAAAALGGGLLLLGSMPRPSETAQGGADALRGLGRRSPQGALTVVCGVAVLTGVPPLLGGLARAALLESAVLSGFGWLAVVTAVAWLLTLVAGGRALMVIYATGAALDARERDRHGGARTRWGLGLAGVLLAAPLFLQPLTGIAGRAAAAVLR